MAPQMASPPDAAAPDPDATHLSGAPAGRPRLAGYLIERPLASGASGTVYRAVDERLGRHVALKVLKDTAFPQARERFLREVRLIAGLVVITVSMGMLGDSGVAGLTRAREPAAPFLLVFEAGMIAWFTSGIVRQVAYPPSTAAKSVWGLRLPLKPWMLRWPGIYRGADVTDHGNRDLRHRRVRGPERRRRLDRTGDHALRSDGAHGARRRAVRPRADPSRYSSSMNGYL